MTFEDKAIDILENGITDQDDYTDEIIARNFAVKCIRLFQEISECTKQAEISIKSQMKLSELKTILNDYKDDDIVQLRVYGASDCPIAELVVNGNTIMTDDY